MTQPFTPQELRDLSTAALWAARDWDWRAGVASPVTRPHFESEADSFRELAAKCQRLANETNEVSA
jgi:hypothetical protein